MNLKRWAKSSHIPITTIHFFHMYFHTQQPLMQRGKLCDFLCRVTDLIYTEESNGVENDIIKMTQPQVSLGSSQQTKQYITRKKGQK